MLGKILALVIWGLALSFLSAFIIDYFVVQVFPSLSAHFWPLFWLILFVFFFARFNVKFDFKE